MPAPSPTRTLIARIATAIAIVALPVGMLSVWITSYVGDTTRYVDTVRPLATDPVIKAAAVDYLDRATTRALDSSTQLAGVVRGLDLSCLGVSSQELGGITDLINQFLGGSSPLGGELMTTVRPLIDQAVRRAITAAVDGPLFAQAWVAANAAAHSEVVAILQGRPSSAGDAVRIPLSQVVGDFTQLLGCKNVISPQVAAGITPSFTLVKAQDLRGARTGYQVLDALGFWVPIVFLVALVVALVCGSSWRRSVLVLGVGFVVGAAVVEGVLLAIKQAITSTGVDRNVLDAVWGALTHGLQIATLVVASISAVAAAGAWWSERRHAGLG